jgi:hydroxymethylpyrimidine/phosphomethylpyrimidine kinase
VQNQPTPLVLAFGPIDPIGALGLPADQAVAASLGCHTLTVSSGMLIADTTRVEDFEPAEANWLDDQARVLLEDCRVAAFKVGALAGPDQVTAVAEILSDYPDVPVVLDPFLSALPDSGLADDDMLHAIRQLLVPQASVLLLSQVELARMAETWRDTEAEGDEAVAEDAAELLRGGCQHVLVKCAAGSGTAARSIINHLYHGSGLLGSHEWEQLHGPFLGAGSTLSAALAALLARGEAPHEAALMAQAYTARALAHARRIGMGKLLPHPFHAFQPSSDIQP